MTPTPTPHPPPLTKKGSSREKFSPPDFGDGGERNIGWPYIIIVQNYSWNIFPVATLKISTLAVVAPLANSVYCISSPNFWKHISKRTRIFAQEPGDSQFSGHCGEKKHSGLAVLVGLIVKLNLWANSPWAGKGPPCQSLAGEGAAKA